MRRLCWLVALLPINPELYWQIRFIELVCLCSMLIGEGIALLRGVRVDIYRQIRFTVGLSLYLSVCRYVCVYVCHGKARALWLDQIYGRACAHGRWGAEMQECVTLSAALV